jgi:hypothetical protein
MLRTAIYPDHGTCLLYPPTTREALHSLHVDGGRRSHPPNGAEP